MKGVPGSSDWAVACESLLAGAWFAALIVASSSTTQAAQWTEDFASDPFASGWRVWGDASLFGWDSSRQVLEVTWDSSRTNSYVYRPLGTLLNKTDSFQLRFQLTLSDIAIGVDQDKPFTFQLALGLIHVESATHTNFFRGSGINPSYGPRNLVEFDYFPDSGFGATWAPTVVSTNNRIAFSSNHPLELEPGVLYDIEMSYDPLAQRLRTRAWREGEPFGLPPDATLADLDLEGFPDFLVDALAVCSYSDGQQQPAQFAGSILARGVVHGFQITHPDPPVDHVAAAWHEPDWQVTLQAVPGWRYLLEHSVDLVTWTEVDRGTLSEPGPLVLVHTNAAASPLGFYRVEARRP